MTKYDIKLKTCLVFGLVCLFCASGFSSDVFTTEPNEVSTVTTLWSRFGLNHIVATTETRKIK